ncbi:glycine cleavage system protein GcvH [Metapseudomonas furukawaii]|jgi:glycine cleavage system H protein|uniref:Glycine cleavage system H protein n=1 Tax=Metapseudomonas furukawaii TaxID=1149133 RepID=A0AAD1FF72_METFU|nr:glycine cleavage system protein GcvH [Pseudomonas furukawaii]ELS28363.1 Glycine cleavage system H protein [Pseudomonas furukawaii]WAG76668.1 glycine cleavage system protein GcvH [Pseudomonas furukawaii]BAU74590.1 glycine cleavage system H protein [Pseudomonas furukawaii]
MSELRYTADHEWLRLEADGSVTVGITEYAQDALGDVVFVQLPDVQGYDQGAEVAVLESVKAASNIVMPLAGEVLEINEALVDSPELVNEDPLGKGWFFRMQPADAGALEGLLDRAAYENLLKANG